MTDAIAIIGGGISGLTLAAALSQHGRPWTIYERAQSLDPVGVGIALMAPSLRILDRLGLLEAAREISAPLPGTRRIRGDGTVLFDIRYPDVWGGQECRNIDRPGLQSLLLSGATGGEVRLGRRLLSARTEGAQAFAEFEGESLTCDALIGADGVRSQVRSSVFGTQPRMFGQQVFRAFCPESELVDRHTIWQGRHAALGLNPLRSGTYLFVNQYRNAAGRPGPTQGRRARVMSLLEDISCPEARAAMALWPEDEQTHEEAIQETPLEEWSWVRGRVALIGDAAHAMSPVLAVGGAVGMEDAWVLADEILAHPDLDMALKAFAERRGDRAKRVQMEAAAMTRRIQSGERGDLEVELRTAYAPLVSPP